MVGCGWKPQIRSESPFSQAAIVLEVQNSSPHTRFRAVLRNHSVDKVLLDPPGDSGLGMSAIYWSPDGRTVALYVCNRLAGPEIVGFDLAKNRPIDGAAFKSQLRAVLKKMYDLPADLDGISWGCSDQGYTRYLAKRPLR